MNAINNPYAVTPPPDKTITQEGVAADAKAVEDAHREQVHRRLYVAADGINRKDDNYV